MLFPSTLLLFFLELINGIPVKCTNDINYNNY